MLAAGQDTKENQEGGKSGLDLSTLCIMHFEYSTCGQNPTSPTAISPTACAAPTNTASSIASTMTFSPLGSPVMFRGEGTAASVEACAGAVLHHQSCH